MPRAASSSCVTSFGDSALASERLMLGRVAASQGFLPISSMRSANRMAPFKSVKAWWTLFAERGRG
ncbi:MAG: hypothetical protein WBE59_04305 [Candidatus Cybelea sp.]